MSGLTAHVVSHVVRRSLERPDYAVFLAPVDMDAPDMMAAPSHGGNDGMPESHEVPIVPLLAVAAIVILQLLIVFSVEYTVGSLMARLAMIESTSTTAIVESKPPAYTEEPDAPLEKEAIRETQGVEVVLIQHKPITGRVVTTIRHLHRIGGFFARWRGLRQFVVYSIVFGFVNHFLATLLTRPVGPIVAHVSSSILTTVGLCRLRMFWTHSMIAMPTSTPWLRRFVPRKQCKPLLLPSFVLAVATQLELLLPLAVAFLTGVPDLVHGLIQSAHGEGMPHLSGSEIAVIIARLSVVPITAILAAIFITLPAAAVLARIEACLLPEDQQTVVPFDRQAVMADIDVTQRGGSRRLYASAWKSFDRAARFRAVKLYAKLFLFQVAVIVVTAHVVVGILYTFGREQIAQYLASEFPNTQAI